MSELGITKFEKEYLEKEGYTFVDDKPDGQEVSGVLMIVHNPKDRHDSGYPFIRAFGVTKGNRLVDMGWHDHYVCYLPTNTDTLHKNIFRVFGWCNKEQFRIRNSFMSCSTLMLRKDGVWE